MTLVETKEGQESTGMDVEGRDGLRAPAGAAVELRRMLELVERLEGMIGRVVVRLSPCSTFYEGRLDYLGSGPQGREARLTGARVIAWPSGRVESEHAELAIPLGMLLEARAIEVKDDAAWVAGDALMVAQGAPLAAPPRLDGSEVESLSRALSLAARAALRLATLAALAGARFAMTGANGTMPLLVDVEDGDAQAARVKDAVLYAKRSLAEELAFGDEEHARLVDECIAAEGVVR
jgi:hypothetical protein